jgi:hypothetical protein
MECPYCGAELILDDHYGTGRQAYHYGTAANGICYPSTYKKLGDIYKCPRVNGFESYNDVLEYLDLNENEFEHYLYDHGYESWEDICCESNAFNGHFYTDENDNLHEGYPC